LYTKTYALASDAAWQVRNCSPATREFHYLAVGDKEIACRSRTWWERGSAPTGGVLSRQLAGEGGGVGRETDKSV